MNNILSINITCYFSGGSYLGSSSSRGEASLPVRQIQVITQIVDPPLVKSMLTYGSRLLKEMGLDRDTDRNHIFADQYGRLLRKIAAYIMISKSNLQPH